MIERVTGGKALPAPVLQQLVAKADGVPLFLEELTKTVLASGQLAVADGAWRLTGPLPALAIPATLHDSLLARLDRLAPVKEVAQVAAAIGREFPRDLLRRVSGLDGAALDNALSQLAEAELIFPHGTPPDTAYASSTRSCRMLRMRPAPRPQAGHPRTNCRRPAGATSNCPPEVLAHHLTEAGETDRSVAYWAQAGRQAVSRAASVEAVAHFRHALAQLLSLPDTVERRRREAELQSALGAALVNVTGLASEALGAAYERARDLHGEETVTPRHSSSPSGISGTSMLSGRNIGAPKTSASTCHARGVSMVEGMAVELGGGADGTVQDSAPSAGWATLARRTRLPARSRRSPTRVRLASVPCPIPRGSTCEGHRRHQRSRPPAPWRPLHRRDPRAAGGMRPASAPAMAPFSSASSTTSIGIVDGLDRAAEIDAAHDDEPALERLAEQRRGERDQARQRPGRHRSWRRRRSGAGPRTRARAGCGRRPARVARA